MQSYRPFSAFFAACLLSIATNSLAVTNFGAVSLPSSSSATVTLTIPTASTLGSISVRTQGVENLDFTNANTGTCAVGTAYTAGATCTVQVNFAPKHAGTRYGAVVLLDTTSQRKVLANAYLQGSGQGPQSLFFPGTTSAVASGWNLPYALTVDGGGNVFVAGNSPNQVFKATLANGVYTKGTTVQTGLSGPEGIAIDGAGNLYIADFQGGRVLKETLTGHGYLQSVIESTKFSAPIAVAVDGSGNVYIANAYIDSVWMETLTPTGYTQSSLGTGIDFPSGVAVDGDGNVFIANNQTQILKETLSGGIYTQTTAVTDLNNSGALPITLDGSGNLYIADSTGSIYRETLSGGTYTQSTLVSGMHNLTGITTDGNGNVYYTAGPSTVAKVDLATPPALAFAPTPVTGTSADSPRIVTVSNLGTGSLDLAAIAYPTDFPQGPAAATDCTSSTSLTTGATCTLSILFKPSAVTSAVPTLLRSETVQLISNTLNAPGTVQSLAVSGNETWLPSTLALTSSASPVTPGTAIQFTAKVTGPGAVPTGSVTFYAGTNLLGTATVISGSAKLTTSALAKGIYAITAVYSGNYFYIPATSSPLSQIVGLLVPTIQIVASPNPAPAGTLVRLLAAVAGPAGNPKPTGIVSFYNGTTLLGTAATSGGVANFGKVFPAQGQQSVTAQYAGDANYTPVTSSVLLENIQIQTFPATRIGFSNQTIVPVAARTTGTIGQIAVRTQGAADQDFQFLSGGGSCSATVHLAANGVCTVLVEFGPKYPGVRQGSVILYDDTPSQNVLGVTYFTGIGLGPQVFFPDDTRTNIYTGTGFPGALALDGDGNIFATGGYSGGLYKETYSAGTYSFSNLGIPAGSVALDSSGNLYVSTLDSVLKQTLQSDGSYASSTIASGFGYVTTLAVDSGGNVYVADQAQDRHALYKLSLRADGGYNQSTITTSSHMAMGLAIDLTGNVYLADHDKGVLKETLSGNKYTETIPYDGPYASSVAVDSVGYLFTSQDHNFPVDDGIGSIYDFTPAGEVLWFALGSSPEALAVDASGNLYDGDAYDSGINKFDFTQPRPQYFKTTVHGVPSTDSPHTVTFFNHGNTPLTISAVNFPADFPPSPIASQCAAGAQLAPGDKCGYSFSFTPTTSLNGSTTPLTLNENATITTNSLNTTTVTTLPLTGYETAPVVATPALTPGTGNYSAPVTITITDATPNSTIYYTTDYSYPNKSSHLYTGPFVVSAHNNVINAIATVPGYINSSDVNKTYVIFSPSVAPTFTPPAGTYTGAQSVTLASPTPGAVIHYTTDGTTPTSKSPTYAAPIAVSTTQTIKALVIASEYLNSAVVSSKYTIH